MRLAHAKDSTQLKFTNHFFEFTVFLFVWKKMNFLSTADVFQVEFSDSLN